MSEWYEVVVVVVIHGGQALEEPNKFQEESSILTAAITIIKDLLFSDYHILFDLESKQSMVETGESTVDRSIKSQQRTRPAWRLCLTTGAARQG